MESTDHLTLSKDEIPLPGTAEGILAVLRTVLNKPYVQSVVLTQGNPIQVTWYRDLSDTLDTQEPDESPDAVLARVQLEELSGECSPKELVVDGMLSVTSAGEFPSHLLVGNIEFFRDCMGIPRMVRLPRLEGTSDLNFAGLPLIEVPSLHRETVVLLSASVRGASLAEAKSGLKLSI